MGRTLWDIAKEYGVSPDDILKANALESEADLHSGAALIIPK
jgi:LysM repeat protein